VQCGLCAGTCPEKVITLVPQLHFTAWSTPPRTIKEEEPFCCIRCATPFGTKSTIDRIIAKLESKHWMFSGENARRLDAVRMCEQCRVESALNEGIDPYAGGERPRPRTAEDYLSRVAGLARGACQKIDQGAPILLARDLLLRHFGSGGVGVWPELEQFCDRFLRPDDAEIAKARRV
jgi:ferredoxin